MDKNKIEIRDIKYSTWKDQPCSACYEKGTIKQLYINNTIHVLCKKCRKKLQDVLSAELEECKNE